MKIERLTRGEAERFRAIRLRSLADSPDAFDTTLAEAEKRPAETWTEQLEAFATFVAVDGGKDVGVVRGVPHSDIPDAAYLISMWVAPQARRRGIGSALIDALVDWVRDTGMKRLFLDVGEDNTAAVALYTEKGFVSDGLVGTLPPPRTHIREFRMVLTLSPPD